MFFQPRISLRSLLILVAATAVLLRAAMFFGDGTAAWFLSSCVLGLLPGLVIGLAVGTARRTALIAMGCYFAASGAFLLLVLASHGGHLPLEGLCSRYSAVWCFEPSQCDRFDRCVGAFLYYGLAAALVASLAMNVTRLGLLGYFLIAVPGLTVLNWSVFVWCALGKPVGISVLGVVPFFLVWVGLLAASACLGIAAALVSRLDCLAARDEGARDAGG